MQRNAKTASKASAYPSTDTPLRALARVLAHQAARAWLMQQHKLDSAERPVDRQEPTT